MVYIFYLPWICNSSTKETDLCLIKNTISVQDEETIPTENTKKIQNISTEKQYTTYAMKTNIASKVYSNETNLLGSTKMCCIFCLYTHY